MTLNEMILSEFDREMATTRRLLERVPEADAAWKPHSKSMALGDLALHVARLVSWGAITMRTTEFDGTTAPRGAYESVQQVLATFDQYVAETRAAITSATEADLFVPWSLRRGDQVMFTLPRAGVLRTFLMNHLIHHRGQLSVYLRMRDVKLPSIYGPTADEGW